MATKWHATPETSDDCICLFLVSNLPALIDNHQCLKTKTWLQGGTSIVRSSFGQLNMAYRWITWVTVSFFMIKIFQ